MSRGDRLCAAAPHVGIYTGIPLSIAPMMMQTEPYEHVLIDVDDAYSGGVIERMAQRKAAMDEFSQLSPGKVRWAASAWCVRTLLRILVYARRGEPILP